MILVDADACPVKEEIYRVAYRYKQAVRLVANQYLRHPEHPLISMQMVSGQFDAADDAIAAEAGPDTVVITGDILLAERCLAVGAIVLGHKGDVFTAASIGTQVATRAIMADLRAGLDQQGVGAQRPFSKTDRSAFLNALDVALRRLPKS